MLDYSDLPYQFLPPKPNRLIMALAQWITPRIVLPGKNHQVSKVTIRGKQHLSNLQIGTVHWHGQID